MFESSVNYTSPINNWNSYMDAYIFKMTSLMPKAWQSIQLEQLYIQV
jgi:hypothetical protein